MGMVWVNHGLYDERGVVVVARAASCSLTHRLCAVSSLPKDCSRLDAAGMTRAYCLSADLNESSTHPSLSTSPLHSSPILVHTYCVHTRV